MLATELRRKYIEFFIGKGHLHMQGAPLVPIDALGVEDKSTLFTSAGMQQFKPFFVGAAKPPASRVVTVQKCVRTGDIDSVGDTSHCTFFEMLGNFSFGDYFKAEVIPWTWEFITEWLKLDADRLCVTVYRDDDEAYDVWHNVVGLPADRIHRLGEDKNYWPANAVSQGPNGPCGPCTEIFYRVVPEEQMTSDPSLTPTQRYLADDDAGRWLEIWNNVFTQFDRGEEPDGTAVLKPLPCKNNDTGAGFERLLCLMQGVTSVFGTDLFASSLAKISELSGLQYGGTASAADFAFRVVAEHTRTTVFCIADGILPSNVGRGYVLRRIMRRAIRYGKTALGFDQAFMHEIAPMIIAQMGPDFPEIVDRQHSILAAIRAEEERFRRTLDNGERRLYDVMALPEAQAAKCVGGEAAFMLYDTFGFPLELTQEVAAEQGLTVDTVGFGAAMEEQRRRSAESSGIHKDVFKTFGAALSELQNTVPVTRFTGYEGLRCEGCTVLALIRDGELVTDAAAGSLVDVVLDATPFYAESGGQVGDAGTLTAPGLAVEVTDTIKTGGIFLHVAKVTEGCISTGLPLDAAVDQQRRMHVQRNHTATHLLHAALRSVLGDHVHQKGSLVAPDRLRFDFTHTQPVTDAELAEVERLVVEAILADAAVSVSDGIPIEEARSRGAMALFGEKYGSHVRMVEVPGVSVELCGGTHLQRTSQVGWFRLVSETGVAAGVRRIEALTGLGAWHQVKEQDAASSDLATLLKTSPRSLRPAVEKLLAARVDLEKEIRRLRASNASGGESLVQSEVEGATLVAGALKDADAGTLAALTDRIAAERGSAVVLVAAVADGKVAVAAKVTPDLVARGAHAGNLVRDVARMLGGGGGGRPDFAQAGGRQPEKVDEALAAAPGILAGQLGKQ